MTFRSKRIPDIGTTMNAQTGERSVKICPDNRSGTEATFILLSVEDAESFADKILAHCQEIDRYQARELPRYKTQRSKP